VCASEGVGRKEGGKEFPRRTTMDDLEDLLSDLNSTLGGIGSGSSSPSARSQVAATSRPDAYGAASKYGSSSEVCFPRFASASNGHVFTKPTENTNGLFFFPSRSNVLNQSVQVRLPRGAFPRKRRTGARPIVRSEKKII
jgi:hypothetical protein